MLPYPPLPEELTCRVYKNKEIIFESPSHWLHPLFELENFLSSRPEYSDREELYLTDRIIGRAAALMIVRIGIPRCAAPVISERAIPVFKKYSVQYSCGELLPRLECMTEDILADEWDPEKAWALLEDRARRAREARR